MADDSWQDLFVRWKDSLAEHVGRKPRQPGHWFSIWRMIIKHPWFQKKLCDCVNCEICSSYLAGDLAGDLEHEVILLLAGKLARRRDLGMDLELAENKFPAFIGTIVRNDCRQVARKLRRQFLRSATLAAPQLITDQIEQRQSLSEMSLEIDELEDPQRTILLLKMKGLTLKEIAEQTQINYSKVCREYHAGCRRLRQTL